MNCSFPEKKPIQKCHPAVKRSISDDPEKIGNECLGYNRIYVNSVKALTSASSSSVVVKILGVILHP
jgi:hypothetical protein